VSSRIELLGRPGCHLCDDARVVVVRVADELGVGWEERDITLASPDEQADYWDKIPVAFVDGVPVDFWRISESRLRAALANPAQGALRGLIGVVSVTPSLLLAARPEVRLLGGPPARSGVSGGPFTTFLALAPVLVSSCGFCPVLSHGKW
jgi:hypothetical protein